MRKPLGWGWRVRWWLKQAVWMARLLLVEPFFALSRGATYRRRLARRLGWYQEPRQTASIWLHARSTGEMRGLLTLARELVQHTPVVVTVTLLKDVELARRELGDAAVVLQIPLPLGFSARRLVRHFDIRSLVLVEGGDLSPLLLLELAGLEMPVKVVSGWWNRLTLEYQRDLLPLLQRVDTFGLRSSQEVLNYRRLGIESERLAHVPELRLAQSARQPAPELRDAVIRLAAGRPVLLAGSTHDPEEEQVFAAFEKLGGGERVLLVVAPREVHRFGTVADLARRRGLQVARRSELPSAEMADVLVVDSLGELAGLYGLARGCFIGNSWTADGRGHNPLEAVVHGIPVAAGPGLRDFAVAVGLQLEAGWWQVQDGAELAALWSRWIDDPRAAAEDARPALELVRRRGRQALEGNLDFLAPLLPPEAEELEGEPERIAAQV